MLFPSTHLYTGDSKGRRQQERIVCFIALIFTPIILALAIGVSRPVYPSNMLPVVLDEEVFVGRDAEVEILTDWIGNSSTISIISIVGSPGVGKSTLAIHVGHMVTELGGVAVHYVDLHEIHDITSFKEKLAFLVLGEKRQTSDYLFTWASKLEVPSLLIIDNCDELLHRHKDAFQKLMKTLVRQSQLVKVVLTVRQWASFLGPFRNFTVQELSPESATNVLLKLSNNLNRTMALEIASLVGNVPLALEVVGSLLMQVDPSTIAHDLRKDPILALSPEQLPSTERIFTRLNISYHYLSAEHQKCGRLIANFPASFDENAIQSILDGQLVPDSSKCVRELYYKSLLEYNAHTRRYRFQPLIKEFFTRISGQSDKQKLFKTFFYRFRVYYGTLAFKAKSNGILELFNFLDLERPNIDLIYDHILETVTNTELEIITRITSTRVDAVLNVLHTCDTLYSHSSSVRNSLLKKRWALKMMKLHRATRVLRIMKLHRVDGNHPTSVTTDTFIKLLQRWRLYFLKGDVHQVLSMGITIGQEGVVHFVADFKFVSVRKGLHTCLMTYVKLLVHLSKLEALVHGKQHAIQMLQSRHSRITQVYSYPTANDTNDAKWLQIYTKYHSTLAHNYIDLGRFDLFLESWKEVLQLKWPLAQCNQELCNSTHLALAHFGEGNYEQSAEHLEALLQSRTLQGNRRVQLFILLHVSYMNLEQVQKASELLTKDRFLSRFSSIKMINATDHKNSTTISILHNEHQTDHSTAWILDQECMTISSENYQTCKILAAFYSSIGLKEATTLARVLNRVLGHHFERQSPYFTKTKWCNHKVYSEESTSLIYTYCRSNLRGLLTIIVIFFVVIVGSYTGSLGSYTWLCCRQKHTL